MNFCIIFYEFNVEAALRLLWFEMGYLFLTQLNENKMNFR